MEFLFSGTIFKHLRGAYTEICKKDKKKNCFLIFSVWYVMNISWKIGTEIRKNIEDIYSISCSRSI